MDWPVRYKDIEPWYDYVETHIGVSGENLGLPQLPDGKLLPPMDLTCVEEHFKQKLAENYSDRVMTIGRTAHITGGNFKGRRQKPVSISQSLYAGLSFRRLF